jgi:hypothetical protein
VCRVCWGVGRDADAPAGEGFRGTHSLTRTTPNRWSSIGTDVVESFCVCILCILYFVKVDGPCGDHCRFLEMFDATLLRVYRPPSGRLLCCRNTDVDSSIEAEMDASKSKIIHTSHCSSRRHYYFIVPLSTRWVFHSRGMDDEDGGLLAPNRISVLEHHVH